MLQYQQKRRINIITAKTKSKNLIKIKKKTKYTIDNRIVMIIIIIATFSSINKNKEFISSPENKVKIAKN